MMFLPDTNAWIHYVNPRDSIVKQRFRNHSLADIHLCDVVLAELYYGAYKSQRQEANLRLIEKLRSEFPTYAFDGAAAHHFGQIRAELEKRGKPIGPYDLQIAATALANDLIVVTHNTGEFGRVPGLKHEDWEV